MRFLIEMLSRRSAQVYRGSARDSDESKDLKGLWIKLQLKGSLGDGGTASVSRLRDGYVFFVDGKKNGVSYDADGGTKLPQDEKKRLEMMLSGNLKKYGFKFLRLSVSDYGDYRVGIQITV